MAPTIHLGDLAKRYYGYNCDSNGYCYYSSWNSWGRWVALVGVVIFFLFLALSFSCINSRRRRRRGLMPVYGTGWLAGKTPMGHNGPAYTGYNNQAGFNNGYNQDIPVPAYSPPVNQQYTGNTFNSNDGYYGQNTGIELQPPKHSYQPQRGGDPVYNAPSGAPPHKNDGFIR